MRKLADGKVDKGFELIYTNLSYRRKFIRTLWMAPLFLLCWVLIPKPLSSESIWLTVGFAILFVVQALHNWVMWNKHERSFSPQKPNGDG